ncbi:MAG: hypothetical protein GY799_26720 [Desulfobulbaceae bacterium]|nr:hypothetical protein [Desulfobulbaceae bacterium]
MTTPAGAKPIITPMPVSDEAAAAAAAAGPGSDEQKVIDDAAAAAAAAKAAEKEGDEKTPEELATEAAAAAQAAKDKEKADTDVNLSLDTKPNPVEVSETGFAQIDAVGKMLGEKGIENANEIMEGFLETGEVSLEHKAVMIEALGEGVAQMAFKQLEDTATTLINEAKADTVKTLDYANKKFNGADANTTWEQIQEYVKDPASGFSEADRATFNTMLEAGGLQAQLVIDKVHAVYTGDKNVSVPGTLLEGDAASTGQTFKPISRIDYTAEMGKAVGKFGEDSPQVRELNRRRTLSMRAGY